MTPAELLKRVVDWLFELEARRNAPGYLVGLSGTDSIVTFLACYRALEMDGMEDRAWGVHFCPDVDFIMDHPEAETHLWFAREIIPWLREQAPKAKIDAYPFEEWRSDGIRWGALSEMCAVKTQGDRRQRLEHQDQYWLVGTRNRTEDTLFAYSNASMIATIQPIVQLWKSDVLDICDYLGVPKVARERSCEPDCMCGRQEIQAHFVRELDQLLKLRDSATSSWTHVADFLNIPAPVRIQLRNYVLDQAKKGFKRDLPYRPDR